MQTTTNERRPWTSAELDLIVADYFSMLYEDLAGRKYVKAHHNAQIAKLTGRRKAAIEFKHQNVSAVLDELGMPWIPGYIPMRNYQAAILPAIERYLLKDSTLPNYVPVMPDAETIPAEKVFVDAPSLAPLREQEPELRSLIRKFDPIERDRRNQALGKAGEEFVVEIERKRLFDSGRHDLSKAVRWTSQEEGDGAGFDVLSYDCSGASRLLEVKTTNGSRRTGFYISDNEYQVSKRHVDDWKIYRVFSFAKAPRIFVINPPLETSVHLQPQSWKASF
jgi:hypothetical protein